MKLVHCIIINCRISRPKFPIALLHKPQRSLLRLCLRSSTLKHVSQLMNQLVILRCIRDGLPDVAAGDMLIFRSWMWCMKLSRH